VPLTRAPLHFDAGTGLLVARSEALPPGSRLDGDGIVWTAGLTTWRKLAARGIWVTGSDESLGESGAAGVRSWFPQVHRWIKLSHSGGYRSAHAELQPTYRTARREALAPVDRYSHFFWNSGTQLREYLQAFPRLREAWHGCGPGNTYRIAHELLGGERLRPFLDADQFRSELLA
jgi:hydroxymethylbilane synthase